VSLKHEILVSQFDNIVVRSVVEWHYMQVVVEKQCTLCMLCLYVCAFFC
jgi:NAD-dependent dihydropyrimidine dehydrogenase PreA subunit